MPIAKELLDQISSNDPTITKLNFTRKYPPLTDEDIQQLSEALKSNHFVKELILSDNDITQKGAITLARTLALLPSIDYLDVSINKIKDKGAKALLQLKTLKFLNLSNNQISNQGIVPITNNNTLTNLIIDCNDINDQGAQLFLRNNSLVEIIIDGNNISTNLMSQIKKRGYENLRNSMLQILTSTLDSFPPEEQQGAVESIKTVILERTSQRSSPPGTLFQTPSIPVK